MPYQAQMIDEGTGFHNLGTGVLKGQEIIEVLRSLEPIWPFMGSITHGFIDLMGVTEFQVSTEEMKIIAELDQQSSQFVGQAYLAIAAPEDLMFGMSRMYGALNTSPGWTIKVFRTLEEARSWVHAALQTPG